MSWVLFDDSETWHYVVIELLSWSPVTLGPRDSEMNKAWGMGKACTLYLDRIVCLNISTGAKIEKRSDGWI